MVELMLSLKRVKVDKYVTNYFLTNNIYFSYLTFMKKEIFRIYTWKSYFTIGFQIGTRAIELNIYRG